MAWKTDEGSPVSQPWTIQLHTSLWLQWLLCMTGFELVGHPPYSLDLAPSEYFLFPNVKRHLAGKQYWTDGEAISAVEDFFEDQDESCIPQHTCQLFLFNQNFLIFFLQENGAIFFVRSFFCDYLLTVKHMKYMNGPFFQKCYPYLFLFVGFQGWQVCHRIPSTATPTEEVCGPQGRLC